MSVPQLTRLLTGILMEELIQIATLRSEGARRLEAIASENGTDSILFQRCKDLWIERELGAELSISSGDPKNARTLLEHGLHALLLGPDLLKKDELPLDDVVKLLGAT